MCVYTLNCSIVYTLGPVGINLSYPDLTSLSGIVVGGSRPSLMICNQPNYILLSILWIIIFGKYIFLVSYF